MMNIYISLPMGGHEKTVRQRFDNSVDELHKLFGSEINIYSPDNISEFTSEGISHNREHDWAWYMGRDIEILLRCDAIYMTQGYLHSPGCMVELAVARERDMKVIYSENAKEDICI